MTLFDIIVAYLVADFAVDLATLGCVLWLATR